jgi:8-oxo-dGTP pyrophosphatase MutT (NUDIX family)
MSERCGAVLITDECREECNGRDYRLPGGKVEGDNTPVEAAMGELQEETGFRAASWRYLCSTQAFTMVRYPPHYFPAWTTCGPRRCRRSRRSSSRPCKRATTGAN